MSRIVAVVLHGLLALLAAGLYFLFVIPRWWELAGDTSHTLGTAMRIVAGVLIALASVPVVLTWLRTRRPEYGTPQLALRLRLCSVVLHVLAGALIIGTAISEIWFSLDDAGRWLFGVYGAAAAVALLGIFSFYLAFVAELPPPPPRPLKKKERKSRWRRRKGHDEAVDEAEAEGKTSEADEEEAEETVTDEKKDEADEAAPEPTDATETAEAAETEAGDDDDETPATEDTLAAEPSRGGLRNRRPSGKIRRPRLRRKSGGVALEE